MAISKVIFNGDTLMDTTQKTVTAGSMLSGVTALKNDGTGITGSIASQVAQTIHPSTTDQTIASGKYLTGAQTVKGVLLTNLSAGNIKKDVVVKVGDADDDDCVASVTGSYEGGGGGSGLVYETGTYTPATDAQEPTISFANTHTNMPMFIMMTDATGTYDSTLNTACMYLYSDYYEAFEEGIYPSQDSTQYGYKRYSYRSSNSTSFSQGNASYVYSSADSNDSSDSYPRYRVNPNWFKPQSNASAYWRAGRTYKWIAVWSPTT